MLTWRRSGFRVHSYGSPSAWLWYMEIMGVSKAVLLWGASFGCRIFKESEQLLICLTLCVHVVISVVEVVDGNEGNPFFPLKILRESEGLGIREGTEVGITENAAVWGA